MADVQDIMGVQVPKKGQGTPRKTPTKIKRPGGATPPPLVPEAPKGYKEKRKIEKKVYWVWRPIVHPARADVDHGKPFISHWVKVGEEDDEYAWAKFNKKLAIPKYTDEQYNKYFRDDDWTKEETDILFEMCERFDLRFIVIHDRFPNPERTIEDLKERYYSIARQLLSLRPKSEDLAQHPVFKYPFNKAQEIERKAQYEKLYRRTKAQIEEEEMLVEELKKIEKAQKKMQADKQRVIKLTQSVIAMPGTEPLPPLEPPTKRRKKSLSDMVDLPGGTSRRKSGGATPRTPVKVNAASVSLRTAQKVEAILAELGIGTFVQLDLPPPPLNPVMTMVVVMLTTAVMVAVTTVPSLTATTATAKAYNDLRQDIVILLDLQNHLEKKEFEVSVLEKQKRDLLALDLLAAHRDNFAQGRRKRSKKRKLDDDADYCEPAAEQQTVAADEHDDEDTPWKKTVGRRGSSRRLHDPPSSTPTTPTTPAAKPARKAGRGRPRSVKKEIVYEAEEDGDEPTAARMDVDENSKSGDKEDAKLD